MSELIAEARVLVRPDTTRFRTDLRQQLEVAGRGVVVPVAVRPVVTGRGVASTQGLAAATGELGAAAGAASGAVTELGAASAAATGGVKALGLAEFQAAEGAVVLATAEESAAAAEIEGAASAKARAAALAEEARASRTAAAAETRRNAQLGRGAVSAALSFVGLRGATLAAGGAFLAGAAGVVAFSKALGSVAGFESTLNVFRVTAGATADEMERVSDTAKQLGADITLPGVSAQDAATALTELSKAGLSVQDSLDGVRGVLQLATAAGIQNEQATLLVANALNAFGLAGTDAVRVADLLASSSIAAQGSIEDIGVALQQSAAAAAQAGISVEDTVTLLTTLARAGLRSSDAGTSLRVALIRLINPAKKAKEELDRLGVAVRDSQGNIRPEIFADITAQLSRYSNAQRDAALATIFGQDAFRAASIIGKQSVGGLNDLRAAVEEQGTAAELANARNAGLSGSIENLKNQVSTLGLEFGNLVGGPAKDFVDIFAGGIENINAAADAIGHWLGAAQPVNEAAESMHDRIDRLNKDFAELVVQAGKVNFAAAVRGTKAGEGLLEEQEKLNKELRDTQSAGAVASDAIEGYRVNLALTADVAEGLRNRIDEAFDRMAHPPPPPPEAATGPIPIGPTAKLNRQAAIAESNEDLRELERVQEIQLANAQKALDNSRGNIKQRTKLFNDVTSAEAALNQTRKRIEDKADADAKKAAADRKKKRDEAEKAFLASLDLGRAPFERAVTRADTTQGIEDDIKRQEQLRSRLFDEIDKITKRTFVTAQDKAKEISARTDQINSITQELTKLNRERDENIQTLAEDRFQVRITAVQATSNVTLITKTLDDRAAELRKAIVAAKGNRELQKTLNDRLREVNQSREQMISDAEEARIHLADIRGQVRGDDDAELPLINKRISRLVKAIAAAKKEHKATLLLETELAETRLDRKKILDDLSDDKDKGTSLADLFRETQDIFAQGGTVGQLPSGLTTSAANAPIRQLVDQRLDLQLKADPLVSSTKNQTSATDRLTASINALIEKLGGGVEHGGIPSPAAAAALTKAVSGEARFTYQRVASSIVEAGVWG